MVDHVAFIVDSIEAGVEWYEENAGALVQYKDDSWAMLLIGNTKLALVLPNSHPNHFAIKCDSIHDFPSGDEELKTHRDGSQYIYKHDPYGNAIEWIHYPDKII